MPTDFTCTSCGQPSHLCPECGSMMVHQGAHWLRCINCGTMPKSPPAADRGDDHCDVCDRLLVHDGVRLPGMCERPSSLDCLRHRIQLDTRRLLAAEASRADLERRAIDAEARWLSLHGELWEGVRAHGLKAPEKGEDGERLIHAYCGGIVEARERVADLERRLGEALTLLKWTASCAAYTEWANDPQTVAARELLDGEG